MAERGIALDEIESVLAQPTHIRASRSSSDRLVLRRTLRGRPLAVVIEGIPGEAWSEVVTAWEDGQDE